MIHRLIPRPGTSPILTETIADLNSISPTMCAAKWNQVTIHLQNGTTHSCHHPGVHKVGLDEIATNPSALHNSKFKKEQRKKMLDGVRPAECDYCWRVEDNAQDSYSDRVYKSAEPWAKPFIKDLAKLPWDADVLPTYVEVSFGNVCNFKCSYCSPLYSSKWMAEIDQHGPYPTSDRFNDTSWYEGHGVTPIPNRASNPYVEAFWEWWPELYPALHHFRITGGEPLMNPNTYKVLEWIIENPRPDLELSINSNMCVPSPLLDKFLKLAKQIINEKKVKKLKIFTSAEAHGKKSDYIRNGMDYDYWLKNMDRFLTECPDISFTVMSTFNALSVSSYREFMSDMLDLRIKHLGRGSNPSHAPMLLDFPYLRFPEHQAAYILTDDYAIYLDEALAWMNARIVQPKNPAVFFNGFHQWEIDKFARVVELVKSEFAKTPDVDRANEQRKNFYKFFAEHDRRRGTSFIETFPEMAGFWSHCQSLGQPLPG